MAKIRLTKIFHFDTGHALAGYDGKCRNVHGHSYTLEVTVIGEPIDDPDNVKFGMVIDFGDLKELVKKHVIDDYDHALVLNKKTSYKEIGDFLIERGHHILLVDFQPTGEMMIQDMAARIAPHLPSTMKLHHLKLYETGTSYAEWYADDQE
ncbi:MAG TPA: 6-carboxytetrahydropterin synthase [Flavobacteriales bacterium]|jgi:6-pyruvoyltetrahydropterin/6-carboxytetrahydropterin synthase|nr:6-carboxytetrahydropterin synthase [Flavobacteriales bacterium]